MAMMDREEEQHNLSRKVLPGAPAGENGDHCEVVELTFGENTPLGIEIICHGNGLLKVSEFVHDSQAEAVCIAAEKDPLKFVGAFIVGINGKERSPDDKGEFYDELKDPSRPKAIKFELRAANSHVSHGRARKNNNNTGTVWTENQVELVFRENRTLGIKIRKHGGGLPLVVAEFPKDSQAEAVAKEHAMHPEEFVEATIIGVNGRRYQDGDDMYEALKTPARPKAVLFKLDDKRLQRNVFATASMRQLSSSVEEMEKMNAEVMVFQEKNKESPTSSTSGAILQGIKKLARSNSSDSDYSPSARPRAILRSLKNLRVGIRSKSPTDKAGILDQEPELPDRVVFGSAIKTEPRRISFISDMEEKRPLPDRIEFQSLDDGMKGELLQKEAKDACLQAIQEHLQVCIADNPNVTYEEWIEELHPENAKSRRNLVRGKSIDHRFYVEGSDHRELWNAHVDGGTREFVVTRDYSAVDHETEMAVNKEKAFARSPPPSEEKKSEESNQ